MTDCLVNAHTTKNVSGRKSDVLDCQRIQQLHTYGLLQASFRPPAALVTLCTYVRQREQLLAQRSSQIQHMQKALHLMNLKLTTVLTDITGLTGQQIICAILAGEHDPVKLDQFRDFRCKSQTDEIAKTLTGSYCAGRKKSLAGPVIVAQWSSRYYGNMRLFFAEQGVNVLYAERDALDVDAVIAMMEAALPGADDSNSRENA